MEEGPWVAIPLEDVKSRFSAINSKVPCTGYPTPGIIDAKTGDVLCADAYQLMASGQSANCISIYLN